MKKITSEEVNDLFELFCETYESFNEVLQTGNTAEKLFAIKMMRTMQEKVQEVVSQFEESQGIIYSEVDKSLKKESSQISLEFQRKKELIEELLAKTPFLIDQAEKEAEKKAPGAKKRRKSRIAKNIRAKER